MPTQLSAALINEKNLVHTGGSWIELWAIQSGATTGIFVANHPTPIVWSGVTFQPFDIERTDDLRDTHGSIPSISVRVTNVDRFVQTRLEAGELMNKLVGRYLYSSTAGEVALTERFRIIDAEATAVSVVFKLGPWSPMEIEIPARRFQRNRCTLVYGGIRCGYNTTRAGALASCDRTFVGANGCSVHGDDEVAAGLPRKHSLNYDGEPSIPKGPFL